ncbi:unnamed protein product, partial [marine sediment metagenome]
DGDIKEGRNINVKSVEQSFMAGVEAIYVP